MKRSIILFVCSFILQNSSFAQNDVSEAICDCPGQHKRKGTFYLTWGYNVSWYSKSDISFYNNGSDQYDFTIYNVLARDRKSDYKNFFKQELTIPQYVYRLGYYFNDKRNLGIEVNFDHTKYIMVDNQTAHLKGTVRGVYYDLDTIIDDDFLQFEHSDGANFLMVNGMKRHYLVHSKDKKHWLSGVLKVGAGIVVPKTRVRLFGEDLDNRFHVAGFVTGLDAGLRYDFFKHFFLESSFKGTFANFSNVLVIGTGKASHHFWTLELIGSFGFQIGI